MRGVLVTVAVLGLAWPAAAQAEGGARGHQERAFAALEAGDQATAAQELFEAFWLTRNLNLLLGAAQAAEQAGLGRQAASYYYLYANLARLPAVEAEVMRRKVTEQHWAAPRAAAVAPSPAAAPAAPKPASSPRTVATSTDPDPAAPPFIEPFPTNDLKQPEVTARPIPRAATPALRIRRPEVEPDKVASIWYGRQILVSEAITVGTLAIGIETDSGGAIALGAIGCALGAPIIHLANGKGGGAWLGAWGLRILGMLIIGGALESGGGVLFGYVVGAGLDAAFVARKDVVRADSSLAIIPTGHGLNLAWTF